MVCNFDALRDFSFALKRLAPATLAKSGTCGLRKVLPNSDFFFASTVEASYIQSQFDINVIPAAKDVTAEILAATNLLLSSSQRNVIITFSFSLILSSL